MSDKPSFALKGVTIDARYRLETGIGRGATAEVYRGTQLVLGRPVAFKILHAELQGLSRTELVQRFFREATCLARLSHPNTVRVFDAGVHDGRPFLVMQYLKGKPLSSLCRRGRIAPLRAVSWLRDVAGALAEAHDQGLVHRDLKPSNILICRAHDGADQSKVIDFGLVKEHRSALELTRAGAVLGTPMYMAPEVALGKDVDARADVYALGITLFMALTAKAPFDTDGGPVALMSRVVTDTPPTLAEAAGTPFPQFLEWVVAGCLAKRVDDRFQDMRALESALRVCVSALQHNSVDVGPHTDPFAPAEPKLPVQADNRPEEAV